MLFAKEQEVSIPETPIAQQMDKRKRVKTMVHLRLLGWKMRRKNKLEKIKLTKKAMVVVIGMFLLNACGTKSHINSNYIEYNDVEEKMTESEEEKIAERLKPKESLEYLFNYLHPDKNDMAEIDLHETENELYYKYKLVFSSSELSDPWILYYSSTTEDGLYQEFGLYQEIWETTFDSEGEYKQHSRNSIGNFWYINTENKEIIPRWILNEDAKDDESEYIDNEEYYKIATHYSDEKQIIR